MADFNPQYRQELAKKRLLEKNSRVFGSRNYEKYAPLAQKIDPYIDEKQGEIREKGEDLQQEREQQGGFDPGKRSELNQARAKSKIARARNMAGMAKDLYKVATPLGVASLLKYVDWFKDWLYMIALMFAIAKDIVDFVGIGSLPAIGTVISICCSIMIFLLMLLAGSGGKARFAKKYMNKFIVLIAGTLAEAVLFGLNFLPIETATVIVIYIMVLVERKQEKESEDKEKASGNAGDDEEEEYA